MIQQRIIERLSRTNHCSRARLTRAEDQRCNPRVNQGTTTHRAGLQADIQRGSRQSVIALSDRRVAQHPDLCVRRWIMELNLRIATVGEHLLITGQDRAYGHLAANRRTARFV